MDRRHFIQGALAFGAMQALSTPLLSVASSFEQYKKTKPWLLGWQSVESDNFAPMQMKVCGKIPQQLRGCFYRNGPAKHHRGEVRYRHWFDGDGMVQKFTLSDKGIVHQGQFTHTSKYLKEEQAGKFLYSGAGTYLSDGIAARNNDSSNTANTALLPWDDELLALWEGGSAYRIDLDTLKTKGLKTWRDDLKHMPFSAHPLVDSDGTLWNFGLAPYAGPNGMMFIYQIAAKTGIEKVQPVTLPMAGFMHDFAITERYLLFYLPPYHYQKERGKTYVERFAWSPEKGGKILLVDKNDLSRQRWFDAPPGFIFHFGNAYQQGNDILLNASWYQDAAIMQHAMSDMMGPGADRGNGLSYSSLIKISLTTGSVTLERSDTAMEFPGFDERFGHKATFIFGAGNSNQGASGHLDRITRFDAATGKAEHFNFAEGIIAEEPLFIARKDKPQEGAGWLINSFLDYRKRQSGITIFDAQSLSSGPIVVATMDRHLPLGFHGCFV